MVDCNEWSVVDRDGRSSGGRVIDEGTVSVVVEGEGAMVIVAEYKVFVIFHVFLVEIARPNTVNTERESMTRHDTACCSMRVPVAH